MSDNKLFTPEDFDKPKQKNHKLIVSVVLLLSVVIFLIFFYFANKTDIVVQNQQLLANKVDTPAQNLDDKLSANPELTFEETETIINESNGQQLERINTVFAAEYIEKMAIEVVKGNYGNNPERRNRLGADYSVIQRRVNEMYCQGLVH